MRGLLIFLATKETPSIEDSSKSKPVDPAGGVGEWYYQFSRGTQSGLEGPQAISEEIEQALGRVGGTGKQFSLHYSRNKIPRVL